MTRTRLIAALSLLIVAQPALAEDRLTLLLRFVPAEAVEGGGAEALMFTDLAAIRDAVPMRLSLVERFSWSADDVLLAELMRIGALPGMLHNYAQNFRDIGRMAEYVGFAWSDMETVVGFGTPPTDPMIVTGGPVVAAADAIGAVLGGHGFEAETRGGHTIWWRLEDNEVNIPNRDPADPLRGHLGGSARAGVVDGAFIAAGNWGGIDWILSAVDGTVPSLAESEDFVALAHAFAQPVTGAGLFLQAYLIDGMLDGDHLAAMALGAEATPENLAAMEAEIAAATATGTPPYSAYGFADRQEGSTVVGIVALAYADRADAETAARTVPAAFANQSSLVVEKPFAEILPYEVAADVVDGPDGARFVARIAFVAPQEASLDGPADNRGLAFQRLLNMLFRRDVGPLVAR